MAHHGAFPRPRVSLWVCTTAGLGLWGTPSALGARWHHALFHRRLGCLRATWGGGATYDWEGTHAAHRAQASSLAHAAPAVERGQARAVYVTRTVLGRSRRMPRRAQGHDLVGSEGSNTKVVTPPGAREGHTGER